MLPCPSTRRLTDDDVTDLILTTADGIELAAEVWRAAEPAGTAVVLVHGFASSLKDPAFRVFGAALAAVGHHVVAYDGRGHGRSTGTCTLGDLEQHDVDAAVKLARTVADRVVLVGASMGAIAVLRYAAEHDDRGLAGVVTISGPSAWRVPSNPRTMLAAMLTQARVGRWAAQRFLDVRIDASWSDATPPNELAPAVRAPLAVVHGRRDRFIPLSNSHELYLAAREPVRLFVADGMSHGFDPAGLDVVIDAVGWALRRSRSVVAVG